MDFQKDIFEIIFFARGGQGAKTAAEVLAQAAVKEGKFVQAFPYFGPERSGAPTKTYLRISAKPVRNHEPVIDPDLVVVLDDTLLDSQNVKNNLSRDEALIVNSKKESQEISKIAGFGGKVYPIDATGISRDIIGEPRPNTVILGKIVGITEIVALESLKEAFAEIFKEKLGFEKYQKNLEAIEETYHSL